PNADRPIAPHVWEAFPPGTPLGEGTLLVGFASQDSNGNPAYDRADNKLIEEKLHSPDNSEAYRYRGDYQLARFARGTLDPLHTDVAVPTSTPGALQAQTWTTDGLGHWTANTHPTGRRTAAETRTRSDHNPTVT